MHLSMHKWAVIWLATHHQNCLSRSLVQPKNRASLIIYIWPTLGYYKTELIFKEHLFINCIEIEPNLYSRKLFKHFGEICFMFYRMVAAVGWTKLVSFLLAHSPHLYLFSMHEFLFKPRTQTLVKWIWHRDLSFHLCCIYCMVQAVTGNHWWGLVYYCTNWDLMSLST